MNRLNGWQRIGVVISVLWCLGVGVKTAFESYKVVSFNASIDQCCREDQERLSKKKVDDGSVFTIGLCELRNVCKSETKLPVAPDLSSLLSLLFVPVILGWMAAILTVKSVKWIRTGFNAK